MKSMDLLETIGSIRDKYILEAHSQNIVQKKRIPSRRLFLIAAIIALMLLLVGCVAYILGLKDMYVGKIVQPGDVIGFMGRTGYSDKENTNNIETVHLHFGMQLVFDESQKECNSEIWINVYPIVRLLSEHRSSLMKTDGVWQRKYPFVDLDTVTLLEGQ